MKISVIIPAYNEEDYIGQCLDAILHQQVMPDEVVVVNNNSTDHTKEIAKKYHVRVVFEPKKGITPARNAGFNTAKYEILARTDADTRVSPDWIKRIKHDFISDESLVAISGFAHFYDLPIHNVFQYGQWETKAVFAFIKKRLKHETLYGPNMAIRKSAWEKIKESVCLDDHSVHEDTDLAIHVGVLGKILIDSHLVVGTSARRWKKMNSYYEQTQRLLSTFKKHRL